MAAVLFVTGGATPTASEQALMDRITALGHTVTRIEDNPANDDHAIGKNCVILPQSVSASAIGSDFRNFTGGVVVCEDGLWDVEQDFGASVATQTGITQLNVLTTAHPIMTAAGVGATGNLTVVTAAAAFTYITSANLGSGAVRLAGTSVNADHICLAAWEAGATLWDANPAPGRRVLFPLKNSVAGDNFDLANATFLALFDAAVDWAASNFAAPPVVTGTTTTPTAAPGAGITADPGTAAGTAAVPTPSVSDNAIITPGTIAAHVDVGDFFGESSATIEPGAVQGEADVPTVATGTGAWVFRPPVTPGPAVLIAGIVLAKPEIAMAADYEATRVILPRIAVARRRSYDIVIVGPADGDEFPVAFGGAGRGRTFDAKVRYSYQEHDEMARLVDLFDLAHSSPDRRLVLRPNQFLVAGLDDVNWIVVTDVAETYVGGQAWDVAFTATTVVGSAAV